MKNVIIAVCIISILFVVINTNNAICQETIIHANLLDKMVASPDSELIRVLIFFKGKKVFSPDELSSMKAMTLSESQSYHACALKQFGDQQSLNVKTIINAGEKIGKCKLIADLWVAYGISCWATKDIIIQIGFLHEVREIVWDCDRPSVGSEIDTDPLLGKKKNTENEENLLHNTITSTVEWGVDKIGAPKVWNLGKRGTGVVVAVLDGGCNYNHPDLLNHLWDGSSFTYNGQPVIYHGWDIWNSDNNPIDDDGHGTLVAGIIAGDGTGGTQTGVAPDVKLMIIKNVHGNSQNETKMIDGLQWLFTMKVQNPSFQYPDIINMSQRIRFDWTPSYDAWRTLCLNVFNAGMIIIAAAGNEGGGSPGGCSRFDPKTGFWVCTPCLTDICPTSESPCGYPIPYSIGVPANIPSP